MSSPPSKRQKTEAASKAKPVLYSYWRSSCSWRVRICLQMLGVDYDYKAVHLVKSGGEQFKDDYKSLNASEEVPTLVVDGLVLTQSVAICEYLVETHKDISLLPKDAASRAKVRALVEIINSGIQPVQNLRVLNKSATLTTPEAAAEAKKEWAKYWIERGLVALEKMLETTAGKFCFGDCITLADLFLIPQVYNAERFAVDMSRFPIIARINKDCSTLPAFVAAHPSTQPDAEK